MTAPRDKAGPCASRDQALQSELAGLPKQVGPSSFALELADEDSFQPPRQQLHECPVYLPPRHLLENALHDAGADAELLADLEDAIALIPERHDLSLDGRLHPAAS